MLQSSICCRIFLPILSSLLPSSLCFYYVDVNRSTGQDYPDNILLMFGCLHWIFYQIFFHTGSHLYQYFDQFPHHSKPCLKELQFGWQSNRGLISLWHFPIGWLKTTLTQIQQSLPKFQCFELSATIAGVFALSSRDMIDEQFRPRDGNATILLPLRYRREKNIARVSVA